MIARDGARGRIALSPMPAADAHLRGVQPVALALSPDQKTLYVAEAGLSAVAVVSYVDLFYPNDHGGGANDIYPDGSQPWSYTRFLQDNDDALGRTVDLISKSPCWNDTVIFVVEDDTQNGFDHVDGHRSIFLAVGPSLKPGYLVSNHISLESVFKTVDLVLGLPPLNLYEATAADLLELWPDPQRDGDEHGHGDGYERAEVRFDRSHAGKWERETKHIDFGQMDADELNLREAIRRSEGLPRKKPEGRW